MYSPEPPATAPLPICVVKNGMPARCTKADSASLDCGRDAAEAIISSGRLAPRMISAARSSASGLAIGRSTAWVGMRDTPSTSVAAMSSGSSSSTGPGRSSWATRKASRTMVGMVRAETICRASLVSGFIVLTMSTIWKRACLLATMPFWPVIMMTGHAPSSA